MYHKGFSLIEALLTLFIAAIIVSLATPGLQQLIQNLRVETAMWSLLEATQTTRSYAIKANRRATMRANSSWQDGWKIFYDTNHNGELDHNEVVLVSHEAIPEDVRIEANAPVAQYISYLGTGESRWANGRYGGAFQAGTLTICPQKKGKGYQLILARGGRVRKKSLEPGEC